MASNPFAAVLFLLFYVLASESWRPNPPRSGSLVILATGRTAAADSTRGTRVAAGRATRAASFDTFISSLRVFYDTHGHLTVPRSFVINSTADVETTAAYPPSSRDMRLGVRLNSVRSMRSALSRDKVDALESIPGFSWAPAEERKRVFIAAVRAYSVSIGAPSGMQKAFVVEEGIDFPPDTWNMKLGLKVHNFLYRGDYSELREELAELSLLPVLRGFDKRHFDFVYAALETYKSLYNHVNVPADFTVPCSPRWREDLWGLKLGYRVRNIRYRGDFVNADRKLFDQLDRLGFMWKDD